MSFRPEGPLDARIMVISDAPDFDRKGVPRPFGQNPGELLGRMLAEAGIAVSSCFVTSAVRERPPGNKIELWAPPTKKGQTELAPKTASSAKAASFTATSRKAMKSSKRKSPSFNPGSLLRWVILLFGLLLASFLFLSGVEALLLCLPFQG